MSGLELPSRYEALAQLGKGGGGEVWVVRDRHTSERLALKVLAEDASDREMAALIREAAALSGLEGLGVPRVVRFGRLPHSGRAYLVRELIEGESLDEVIRSGNELDRALLALSSAADQLTVLHRAGLLHGDVKPANIIVQPGGSAAFVDLGLAAPWREGGSSAEGLTPRYAAPELFAGGSLTVRAEVYALGVTLAEALSQARSPRVPQLALAELRLVAERATAAVPQERYPSVDELASALRRAAGLAESAHEPGGDAALWPVVGVDNIAGQLLEAAHALSSGESLRLTAPPGAGRTSLLRRLGWSLGAEGNAVALLDADSTLSAVSNELGACDSLADGFVLADDADAFEPRIWEALERARAAGARLVLVGGLRFGQVTRELAIPPLDASALRELLRRAIPSLSDGLLARIIEVSGGRPGELRSLVRRIASEAVASSADIERLMAGAGEGISVPSAGLERATYFLDRGRYNDAQAALDATHGSGSDEVPLAIARARLELGLGDAAAAIARLAPLLATPESAAHADELLLYLARARLGVGEYAPVIEMLAPMLEREDALGAEMLACHGMALSLLGRHEEARLELDRAVESARKHAVARVEAVTLASLAFALNRADRVEEARLAYQQAEQAAERASDAGMLAVVRSNLAALLTVHGDIAGAIDAYEAALDMGRRSGRRQTARQALLNLANLDLYLGRLARARVRIDALERQRTELPPMLRAQLSGLHAELHARQGQLEPALNHFDACAAAFEALGRGLDAAEARLEAVLTAARHEKPDLSELRRRLNLARAELSESSAHRPLQLLASSRVAACAGDESEARLRCDEALAASREAGKREWTWRALEARAELEDAGGQPLLARRDREEALAVLEEIGARLPRDLREVYWNDPRRAQLRASVPSAVGNAATEFLPFNAGIRSGASLARSASMLTAGTSSISQASSTPLEQRMARILGVNAELVGEHDVGRLTARITDYAVELARAERGFVLLRDADGNLTVHTSRARGSDAQDEEFSRSIAEKVMSSREPLVAMNAQNDARMLGYASVHQMSLESVACVPISAPSGRAIGALYVETRLHPGSHFERELPTLQAFADQVAIALENARLINENRARADELAAANVSLEEAQARLRELLGDRTEQLKRARRRLRDARDTLYGHFGYHGLVGTSAAMRRVYALIERVKDTDVPVLITGESGTGKEMVARAIHDTSARSKGRMLGVNCGAIPENLLESELFGHVRGAFTGADRERKGLFRECDGGTILLDEIGETPPKMQAGLLRVLQERKVRPVGGSVEETVDARVIFATNRELESMVRDGKFREDLYYRIHVVEVRIPSLREHSEDIPQLVDHFFGLFAARYKRSKKLVSREALRVLCEHDWPGNVRQLENVLLNAWVMSDEEELLPEDFDLPELQRLASEQRPHAAVLEPSAPSAARPVKGTTSEHQRGEREKIIEALRACNWNRVKAAELSGIPRRTFYRRLREYGIQ